MRPSTCSQEIIRLLRNRKGFSHWWDGIQREDQASIEEEITTQVEKAIDFAQRNSND